MRILFSALRVWKCRQVWMCAVSLAALLAHPGTGAAQSTTQFKAPLIYGYQADPMIAVETVVEGAASRRETTN
jgi:hypothetical protein